MQDFGLHSAAELLRPAGAHDSKYTRGVVGLITGSEQYPGAAVLGVEGATRAGAGYVRYVGPRRCQDLILARRPETVLAVGASEAWVIGSGMESVSSADPRYDTIMKLLDPRNLDYLSRAGKGKPVYRVVDAGALLDFAKMQTSSGDQGRTNYVVTPHSGELARILRHNGYPDVTHSDVDESDDSRVLWAQRARDVLGCTVVLKGAKTLIVPPDGEMLRVCAPTHWLATAGTGDVLAGIMGTVVAQFSARIRSGEVSLAQAAATAVVLHGYAAGLASATMSSDDNPQDAMSLMLTTRIPGQPIVACDIARALPVVIGALLAMRQQRGSGSSIGFKPSSTDSASGFDSSATNHPGSAA